MTALSQPRHLSLRLHGRRTAIPSTCPGAADTSVAMATGSITQLLDWLDQHGTAAQRCGETRDREAARTHDGRSPFDVRAFLDSAGISRRIVRYARASIVFAQGGQANSVFYIQQGGVKGCLAGQPLRIGTRRRWYRRACCGFGRRR